MDISNTVYRIIEENLGDTLRLKTTLTERDSDVNISKIVDEINKAYHQEWEKQKLEFARNFLARTWAGMPLPVLSLCGKGTQEIRYSTYLGYFLDGSKPHGLGTRFLDALILFVNDNKIDTYQSVVENEKWIGRAKGKTEFVNCYCDIVISCNHHVIFIEQKIRSGESLNPKSETTQLARYDEAIKNNNNFNNKESIRIFLTPTGKQSEKSPKWAAVSYHDLVRIGINILQSGGLSSAARENLKRFLLDLLLGPFDKTENEIQELVELAEKAVMEPSFKYRLRFDRMASRNSLLIKLIMEG